MEDMSRPPSLFHAIRKKAWRVCIHENIIAVTQRKLHSCQQSVIWIALVYWLKW